jgi:hypothetical protein
MLKVLVNEHKEEQTMAPIGGENNYKKSWQKFCDEIGAEYIDGGLLGEGQIAASFNVWTIIFSISMIKYWRGPTLTRTQINAPFVRKGDEWRFKVYRTTFFSSLAQAFGIQDIQIGEPEFDQTFVLKSSDKSKAQALFGNQRIRELLKAQIPNWDSFGPHMSKIAPKPFHAVIKSGWFDPTFRLEIKRYKKGISQLYFEQDTLITETRRLRSIYELFSEVLTQLCKIGVATEADPDELLY